MGGEPTFISIDDMDAPEWNTTADSPHKRELANDLFQRLRNYFWAWRIVAFWTGEMVSGRRITPMASLLLLAQRRSSRFGKMRT